MARCRILMLIAVAALTCVASVNAADSVVQVRAAPLAEIAVYPERAAPATVTSNSDAQISAEIAATVTRFEPRVGDIVAPGGVIATLDCRDFRLALDAGVAELEVLQARLALAERRYTRAAELRERNSLAVETLDERASERDVLLAEIRGRKARNAMDRVAVERCVVRSPFRALLTARLAPPGQYVAAGSAVARVIDIEDLELSARVSLRDVAAVMTASALRFETGEESFAVTPRTAVAAVSTESRNREIRLDFTDRKPLSGSAGQLLWSDARAHVPGRVLVRRDGALGLFIVTDNKASFVSLPDAQAGRANAVSLAPDARIVIDGQYGLRDGQPVSVLKRP